MKRATELLNSFDKKTRIKLEQLAKDMASFNNIPIEDVYRDLIFPVIYKPPCKKDLENYGVKL